MIFNRLETCEVLGIPSEILSKLLKSGELVPNRKMNSRTMWFLGKTLLAFIERNKPKGEHVEKISK